MQQNYQTEPFQVVVGPRDPSKSFSYYDGTNPGMLESHAINLSPKSHSESKTCYINLVLLSNIADEYESKVIERSWDEKLKEIQRALGFNVSQLAASLNVSRMQYYKWIDDEKIITPNEESLKAIDYLYNMTLHFKDWEYTHLLGKQAKRQVFAGELNLTQALASKLSLSLIEDGINKLMPDLKRMAMKSNAKSSGFGSNKSIDDITGFVSF